MSEAVGSDQVVNQVPFRHHLFSPRARLYLSHPPRGRCQPPVTCVHLAEAVSETASSGAAAPCPYLSTPQGPGPCPSDVHGLHVSDDSPSRRLRRRRNRQGARPLAPNRTPSDPVPRARLYPPKRSPARPGPGSVLTPAYIRYFPPPSCPGPRGVASLVLGSGSLRPSAEKAAATTFIKRWQVTYGLHLPWPSGYSSPNHTRKGKRKEDAATSALLGTHEELTSASPTYATLGRTLSASLQEADRFADHGPPASRKRLSLLLPK
jgi:hypothetical protein